MISVFKYAEFNLYLCIDFLGDRRGEGYGAVDTIY